MAAVLAHNKLDVVVLTQLVDHATAGADDSTRSLIAYEQADWEALSGRMLGAKSALCEAEEGILSGKEGARMASLFGGDGEDALFVAFWVILGRRFEVNLRTSGLACLVEELAFAADDTASARGGNEKAILNLAADGATLEAVDGFAESALEVGERVGGDGDEVVGTADKGRMDSAVRDGGSVHGDVGVLPEFCDFATAGAQEWSTLFCGDEHAEGEALGRAGWFSRAVVLRR